MSRLSISADSEREPCLSKHKKTLRATVRATARDQSKERNAKREEYEKREE